MGYMGFMDCFRCGKRIDHPDASNADYIIALDTMVREPREILIALKHNQATLEKQAKMLGISDDEYDRIEVPSVREAMKAISDLVKVVAEVQEKDIQKTGIVCPDCWKPTDKLIWGVHKGK